MRTFNLKHVQYVERIFLVSLHALLLFFFLFLLLRFFIISTGVVDGRSMEPAFIDDELFFVNKLSYAFRKPKRYDLVQVIDPHTDNLVIKRIIGLPGETLIMKRSSMYRFDPVLGKDVLIDESAYLKPDTITRLWDIDGKVTYPLGDHEYFILGDNRAFSIDSRTYGAVDRSRVVGKVIW